MNYIKSTKKGVKAMEISKKTENDLKEIGIIYEQLTPENKWKFIMKYFELLEEQKKQEG